MPGTVARTLALFPWMKLAQSLLFWQAVWFLYFQQSLSAADALLLYALYEISVTALEVPSGYMSDRLGRRRTLLASGVATLIGTGCLALGDSFAVFACGQALIGAGMAFASGTDSALLFETLASEGRKADIEAQELTAWRFGYAGSMISAVIGGMLYSWDATLPFWASILATAGFLLLVVLMREPPRRRQEAQAVLSSLQAALRHPVLRWLFAISLLMYVFSHIPFVFGQPFILEALASVGWQEETPEISGAVTATMMGVSLLASLAAPRLRGAIGLAPMVLVAFGMQIALCAVLALTNSALAIAFLFLRMVPDALSRPFVMARIQPLLQDGSRASYLSVKSLSARILFSASLWLASGSASDVGTMAYAEMRVVLGWYVLAGVICLIALATTASRRITDD